MNEIIDKYKNLSIDEKLTIAGIGITLATSIYAISENNKNYQMAKSLDTNIIETKMYLKDIDYQLTKANDNISHVNRSINELRARK